MTFSSPSVYLSFGYLVGVSKTAGEPVCGQPTSEILVSIPPESLSSVRTVSAGASATVTTLPFNYADMNAVPKDVYQGMARCWPDPASGNVCSTVYDDYSPHLVIPDAIRQLVPFWQNCDPCLEGVLDPPIPLTKADSLFPRAAPTAARERGAPQTGFVSSTRTSLEVASPTWTPEALSSESAFAQYTDKTPPPAGPPVPVSMTKGPWHGPENSTVFGGGENSDLVEDGPPTTTSCASSHSTVETLPTAHGEGAPVVDVGGWF
ncbi:hypothetical protein SLS56_009717 [Neofusicoccum ribis]|uniref:Uncharacterized protein n=1 Tax=Neofusicoccum ribis TaxID=45134 RepID=A0ABR3SGJ6_9PEZI